MAAAYAALISLFNNLELIQYHPRHSFHFEDKQIRSLQQSVCFLIDFMQSCDYHAGEDLERRIASAAHAAEDVLESHVVDQIHSGSTLGERKPSQFLLDLQKVIESMEFVSRKAMQVTKAHGGFKAEQPAHCVSSTPLIYKKSNNTMVGFDDVLLQLLDLLTGEPSSREVIPIVGMGGSGKTTLARNAFEHKLTMQHFDVCVWVTISQQYSVKEIRFQRKSAAGESEIVCGLGEQLHKILWGRRYLDGKTYKCKIHDLLRELCLKIAEKEKFFHHVLSTPRATHMERRVLIVQDPKIIEAPISAPTVRSLKCQEAAQLPFDLRLLRVQNKVGRALTNEVDGGFIERNLQYVNLQYLRCSIDYRDFKRYLPPSISRLWNLQTLIVEGNYEYVIAPYEIWEMPQLRHLEFNLIFLPNPYPGHSFDQPLGLRNLQRVMNLWLSEEVCKRIPDIKELSVIYYNLERVGDEPKSHYSLHNLGRLDKLEVLACSFSQGPQWHDLAFSLIFPSSLKELYLTNPHLQWEELTMMLGFLPNLYVLCLGEVKAGPEWNPVEGGFPNLKALYIHNCPNLICWNADSSHFPVLERLSLQDLSKLDNFPSGLGEIPTLEYISLNGCSVSLAISAMRMLVEQEEEQGSDDIRLRVYFGNDLEKQESFEKHMEEEGLKSDHLYLLWRL